MERNRRGTVIYGLLFGVWALVVLWQIEEHSRVQEAARRTLRSRATEIGSDLSAVIRALSFRGRLLQQQLEPVLNERVNGHTNEFVNSSGLIYIALLNNAGEPIADALNTNLVPSGIKPGMDLTQRESWTNDTVTFVDTIEGASKVNLAGETNPVIVLPPPPVDFTNDPRGGFPRREETNLTNIAAITITNLPQTNVVAEITTNGPTPTNF